MSIPALRSMATQISSEMSPAMYAEFALQHEPRRLERWGLTYYGYCEPSHRKLDLLTRTIGSLRNISISPQADVASAAEQLEGRYVLSIKPSPAFFAPERWDRDLVHLDLAEKLEQTEGCKVELNLSCTGSEAAFSVVDDAIELACVMG